MLLPIFWCMIEPITKNLGGIACYIFLFQLVGYNLQLQRRWEICWVASPSVSCWVVSLHVWRPRKRFLVHPCRWTNLILPSSNKWFVLSKIPVLGNHQPRICFRSSVRTCSPEMVHSRFFTSNPEHHMNFTSKERESNAPKTLSEASMLSFQVCHGKPWQLRLCLLRT